MLDGIAQIKVVDVTLPTKRGLLIRNICIAQPNKAQAVLLQMLGLHLSQRMAGFQWMGLKDAARCRWCVITS